MILTLAPETNGNVALKPGMRWVKSLAGDHKHLAEPKHEEKIRFRDIQAQPRGLFLRPPVWSGR